MPKSYEEKYETNLELSSLFFNRFNDLKNEIKVQLPCKVHSVDYENNQVDVEILDYDSDERGQLVNYPIIPNVPIRQPLYSGKAFIVLPVQIGDVGTIEFFDSSVDDLIATGNFDYDYSEEWHSLDFGLFTNGFLPKGKVFPIDSTSKIHIGTHSGSFTFKVNANDELVLLTPNINIVTGTLSINGNVEVTGDIHATGKITGDTDVVAGGKSGKSHTHTDSQSGTTSPPN